MSNKNVYNLHTKVKQEQNLQTLYEFGVEQEQLIKPLLEKFSYPIYLYLNFQGSRLNLLKQRTLFID